MALVRSARMNSNPALPSHTVSLSSYLKVSKFKNLFICRAPRYDLTSLLKLTYMPRGLASGGSEPGGLTLVVQPLSVEP